MKKLSHLNLLSHKNTRIVVLGWVKNLPDLVSSGGKSRD